MSVKQELQVAINHMLLRAQVAKILNSPITTGSQVPFKFMLPRTLGIQESQIFSSESELRMTRAVASSGISGNYEPQVALKVR